MKLSSRSIYLQLAAVTLAFSFALSARAETPREEVQHAYHLLKWADSDYHGHKSAAMDELKAAGKKLGLDLEGAGWEHENQRKSDIQLSEARTLIRDARDKMEAADRDKVARHLEKAVKELDTALAIK
jgi:hypothetical protein